MNADDVAACVAAMRARRPLVQCIPNVVAAEITANVLMAAGAAPAMVIGIEEAPEFAAAKAGALSLNCGALTAERLASMREAAAAAKASDRRPPWVLDPVACGGTTHRTRACRELLALGPAVVRGNASEVLALTGAAGAKGPRGVDASDAAEAALPAAASLAREHGMVFVVSGPTDYVTDGAETLAVRGGSPMVTQVTGTGCALSALVVAFVASSSAGSAGTALRHAAACCAFYKACAAASGTDGCPGPGSFKLRLLDALAMPDAAVGAAVVDGAIRIVAVDTPTAAAGAEKRDVTAEPPSKRGRANE